MPTTFDQTAAGLREELIRKQLVQAVFAADESVPVITAPFVSGSGELAPIPDGYVPIGYTTEDGLTFPSDVSMSDVTSSQSGEPTRSDIESDVLTAEFQPQETNRATVALYEGLPLAGDGAIGQLGEAWTWDRQTLKNPYRRLLFIGVDPTDAGDIYVVKFMPRARRTDKDDEQWNRSDPTTRPLTVTAYRDSAYGTSCRNWVDGPGWRALAPLSNEVQSIAVTGGPTGGTYTLTYGGQTTAGIAYNATATQVRNALTALSSIGTGNVSCSGGPHPDSAVTVTFTGALAGTDVAQMTASGTGLTGGTSPDVTVSTVTPGGA